MGRNPLGNFAAARRKIPGTPFIDMTAPNFEATEFSADKSIR
jgi:hypothetical protein